jgi:hypothetical protein
VKLIYIGGYGHSGSTLLEYLMTGCKQVIACGEVVNARLKEASARTCSCGRPAGECPVWRFISDPALHVERWDHAALDGRLLDQVGAGYDAIVDSSKTAWRASATPFKLRREFGRDFLLVHIVRDPRAVCWSLLKRDKRVGGQSNDTLLCTETALGWSFANLACEMFRRRHPDQYCRIRYEDLVRHPSAAMTALMRKVLPDRQWAFETIGACDNRHQLYANRMRTQDLFLDRIKEDDTWRMSMPSKYRRLVAPLSWRLRARYGYE